MTLHALDIHSLLRAAAPDDVPVVSVDDAVDALSARAGELAELSAMAEPFAAFHQDQAKAAFHTGLSPMRLPARLPRDLSPP